MVVVRFVVEIERARATSAPTGAMLDGSDHTEWLVCCLLQDFEV